jgi:hypothetical protein
MKATFLSTEVLEKSNKVGDKLKVEMKRISVDDHMWCLKSWEKDGKAIVKLYYGECNKLHGNSTGDWIIVRPPLLICLQTFQRNTQCHLLMSRSTIVDEKN